MRARSTLPYAAPLLVLGAASLLSLFACPESSEAPWRITFADETLRARASVVEAQVLQGDCDSTEVVYSKIVPRDQEDIGPGILPEGQYGFFARAGDADCYWYASGCVVRTMPIEVEAPVELVLTAAEEEPFCQDRICEDGQCRLPVDADVDADQDEPIDPPVLLSPHNGWATGSIWATEPRGGYAPLRPRFRWSEVEGAVRYEIQADNSCAIDQSIECEFSTAEIADDAIENSFMDTGDLDISSSPPVGNRYRWRVRACNTSRCSDWTAPWYLDAGRLPNDYDGNGYSDVAISAIGYSDEFSRQGIVYLFSGSSIGFRTTVQPLQNPAPSENANFGSSISPAGDVDGDGFADLVVGQEPGDRVTLYLGGSSGLDEGHLIEGDLGSRFGHAVAGVGDVDADGYADVIIGSPKNAEPGIIYFIRGSPEGLLDIERIPFDNPDDEGEDFGLHLAAAGDLNADGFADFVVGAPRNTGGGQAIVYYGSPTGPIESANYLYNPEVQADAQFGNIVAPAGDLDRDGYSDVAVSAPSHDGEFPDEGRVHLFRGGPEGHESTPWITLMLDNAAIAGQFGLRVASVGDIDRNGFDDLIVGATFEDVYDLNDGAAYLFLGTEEGISAGSPLALRNPQPGHQNAHFGTAASSSGDINGDGYPELLISAPGQLDGVGVVFWYDVDASGVIEEFAGTLDNPDPVTETNFGHALECWVVP